MLRFWKRKHGKRWASLDALAQRRAALLWRFAGRDEYPTVDDVLASESHGRWVVRDERGVAVAEWWQIEDGGLLFAAVDDRPIGHAIQHGFVCEDRALWTQLAQARSAPTYVRWALDGDAERARGDSRWSETDLAQRALVDAVNAMDSARSALVRERSRPAQRLKANARATKRRSAERSSAPAQIGEERQAFEKGEAAFIRHGATWYSGRIERVRRDGRYLVSYDGWDAEWNEVVGLERLRGVTPPSAQQQYLLDQPVFVAYGRYWYPGRIVRIEGADRYLISYDGWHSGWNEVVGPDRLSASAPMPSED